MTEHRANGHQGPSRTDNGVCEPCVQSKVNRRAVPKKSKFKPKKPLEVIDVDIQDMTVVGWDGTSMNLKIVDCKSGYIYMKTLKTKTASETARVFEWYVTYFERQSGHKIKLVRTDSGNEFRGDFEKVLVSHGIHKFQGQPYDHHFPPHAERAHQTIMKLARAMMEDSKLPAKYYIDAQLAAVYVYNRSSKAGEKSPYELLFGKAPYPTARVPFGCIGYAKVAKEKLGKLDPVRFKVRFLGYAENDAPIIRQGWKVLVERTGMTLFHNDVKWYPDMPLTPITVNSTSNPFGILEEDDHPDDVSISSEFTPDSDNSDESSSSDIDDDNSDYNGESISSDIDDGNSDYNGESSTSDRHGRDDSHDSLVMGSEDAVASNESTDTNTDESLTPTPNRTYLLGTDSQPLGSSSHYSPPRLRRQTHKDYADLDVEEDNDSDTDFTLGDSNLAHSAMMARVKEHSTPILEDQDLYNALALQAIIAYKDGVNVPQNLQEAQASPDWPKWKQASKEEDDAHVENGTWDMIVPQCPSGVKPLGSRRIYTLKRDEHGNIIRFKTRIVAKGFTQRHGIDYDEIFSPVLQFKSVRVLKAISASHGYKVYQDDVKTAFLNAPLDKGMWMKHPDGKGYVFLRKALYGLKQAPREWYDLFSSYLIKLDWTRLKSDPCIFTKTINGAPYYIGVYVDDILSSGKDKNIVDKIRDEFRKRFKMSSGGLATHYLGIQITQDEYGIRLNQTQYIKDKLLEFENHLDPHRCFSTPLDPNFQNLLQKADSDDQVESSFPYREMVGSLIYLTQATRFDIATAVSVVSRFLAKPKKIHCDMVRKIFYYLRGSMNLELVYSRNNLLELYGYCDASYANAEGYKSMSGYVFMLGKSIISWYSTKQPVVALSTMEAEYIALTPAGQEAIWLKGLLEELGYKQETVKIFEDNQACMILAKNPQNHKKSKHIQVRFHWIRDLIKDKIIKLEYCKTSSQLADILTKGLSTQKLRDARHALGLRSSASEGELKYGLVESEARTM